MREVEQDSRKDLKLRDLRYADDRALLSTPTEGLHQLINSLEEKAF